MCVLEDQRRSIGFVRLCPIGLRRNYAALLDRQEQHAECADEEEELHGGMQTN